MQYILSMQHWEHFVNKRRHRQWNIQNEGYSGNEGWLKSTVCQMSGLMRTLRR